MAEIKTPSPQARGDEVGLSQRGAEASQMACRIQNVHRTGSISAVAYQVDSNLHIEVQYARHDYGMIKCPAHPDNNPSCKITDDPRKSDGVDVICFAGCPWQDIKEELVKLGLISSFEMARDAQTSLWPLAPVQEPEPEPDERALALWNAGVDIERTLAERYLCEHRKLAGPFPFTLRYLPSVAHPGSGLALPALVAALQRPDRKVVAVQVTFLRARDGAKATMTCPRLTIGKMGAGAVRLAPAGEVLGFAEGVETALSAQQISGLPVWACLGAQRMSKVSMPAYVKHVHIFGDNDGPGREQADKAVKRFVDRGLRVTLRFPPPPHLDYNDLLCRSKTQIGEFA